MRDDVGKMSGRQSRIYSMLILVLILIVIPAGDKSIFANPVTLKGYIIKIMRRGFRGMYNMKRGITEVRFDDQFEPMKFGILT